jgi:hypothetical protein
VLQLRAPWYRTLINTRSTVHDGEEIRAQLIVEARSSRIEYGRTGLVLSPSLTTRQTITELSLLSAFRHLSSVPPLLRSCPGLSIGVINNPHPYVHLIIFERLTHDKNLLLQIQPTPHHLSAIHLSFPHEIVRQYSIPCSTQSEQAFSIRSCRLDRTHK